MATRKRFDSDSKTHFVTFSVYNHAHVFRNKKMVKELIDILNFYKRKDRFKMYAYVVMPSHVHLLVKLNCNENISDLIRDIKKYFSYKAKNLLSVIAKSESKIFYNKGKLQFWERGFDEVTIISDHVFKIKLQYIMNNPVKSGLADMAKNYPFLYVCKFDELEI